MFYKCTLVYLNQSVAAKMAVKKCCCAKLSPNKKSIFGFRMNTQILCLLVGACLLAVTSAADTQTCTNVRSIFEKKGMLSTVDIQTQPNSGENDALFNK